MTMRKKGSRIIESARRMEAGRWTFKAGGHVWYAWRVRTEYGDLQWIIDRDDSPAFAQCQTVAGVRATIISAVQDAKRARVTS